MAVLLFVGASLAAIGVMFALSSAGVEPRGAIATAFILWFVAIALIGASRVGREE